jgi:hypothetical protein
MFSDVFVILIYLKTILITIYSYIAIKGKVASKQICKPSCCFSIHFHAPYFNFHLLPQATLFSIYIKQATSLSFKFLLIPPYLSFSHCLFLNSWIFLTNIINLQVNLVVYIMNHVIKHHVYHSFY